VSDIVETQFGFHLIRLDSITPEYIRPFSEVEVALKQKLSGDTVLTPIRITYYRWDHRASSRLIMMPSMQS
jgi:hypothetical protein